MSQRAARIEAGAYIAMTTAIGFLTFYSLPHGIPFLVRQTMMTATQWVVGEPRQRPDCRTGYGSSQTNASGRP